MGEKEDKEKAEKLAAAKKRVAQLKKKKAATAAGGEKSSTSKKDKSSQDDTPKSPTKVSTAEADDEDVETIVQDPEDVTAEPAEDADEALFNDAIKSSQAVTTDHESEEPDTVSLSDEALFNSKIRGPHGRQPSLSLQSKLRSSSFRKSTGPISPALIAGMAAAEGFGGGDTMPDIYRKQASRIEELEKENETTSHELQKAEQRWRKLEEELEEVREQQAERKRSGAGAGSEDTEVAKLRAEIARLTVTRQRERAGSTSKLSRSGSVAEPGELENLRKQAESKDSTISDMSLEISRLRSQISEKMAGCETHGEQIEALQGSLSGSEDRYRKLETELADARKAIVRSSERSVRDGTEKTSREMRIKELEREVAGLGSEKQELAKHKSSLEKKLETMGKLHREAEDRHAKRLKEIEGETKRLRDEKIRQVGRGGDDVEGDGEGVEELEDEERQKLQRRVRELEGEVFELRRGHYRDRRGISGGEGEGGKDGIERPSFEVDGFDDVDLSGGKTSRSRSFASTSLLSGGQQTQAKHSGFSQVLNSGLAAFRGSPDHSGAYTNRPRADTDLQEFDDDDDAVFDEAEFARAQREEEARKMVEHVREVKRGLKGWKGWRLDLVESGRNRAGEDGGGGWFGEVFDV